MVCSAASKASDTAVRARARASSAAAVWSGASIWMGEGGGGVDKGEGEGVIGGGAIVGGGGCWDATGGGEREEEEEAGRTIMDLAKAFIRPRLEELDSSVDEDGSDVVCLCVTYRLCRGFVLRRGR